MKRRKCVQAILLTAAMLLCAAQANAALITIQFSGHVTSVSGNGIPDTIKTGDIFTGSYTYDLYTVDSAPTNDKYGEYLHSSPHGISVFLGGYEFKTDHLHHGQFSVLVDMYYANRYYYIIKSNQNTMFPFESPIEEILWALGDITRSVLSSDALLTVDPNLDEWDYNILRITGADQSFRIEGKVTQVTLIPEPSTGLFLLSSIAYFLRRKK